MKILAITSCGSTNEELRKRIDSMTEGSPLPPAIAALEQTGGRGRKGRSFSSPYGKGLYLSVPLEVSSMEDALLVTPMASVCVCRTLSDICGLSCSIKWPNDILFQGRKICGILTELAPISGHLYLILGIGINLSQDAEDFPEDIREKAISVKQAGGTVASPVTMANALVPELETMIKALPEGKAHYADYLEFYRERCTTTGRKVNVVFADGLAPRKADAIEISDDFGLLVRWEDGTVELLRNGEVSIR